MPSLRMEAHTGTGVIDDEKEGEAIKAWRDTRPLGQMLDRSYAKLGEWLGVRPDVLVSPSILTPFARVCCNPALGDMSVEGVLLTFLQFVEGVTVINPGPLSKRQAPGTYARMVVLPKTVTDEDREAGTLLAHELSDRARVDIIKM